MPSLLKWKPGLLVKALSLLNNIFRKGLIIPTVSVEKTTDNKFDNM